MTKLEEQLSLLSDLEFRVLCKKIETAQFINGAIEKGVSPDDIAQSLGIDDDTLNLYRRGAAAITIRDIATIEYLVAEHAKVRED